MISNTYTRVTGWITILSGGVAFLSYYLVAASVDFHFEFFADPVLVFSLPQVDLSILRWSMITDVFGYYLFLLPALFLIHERLNNQTPWANLLTFCGASYILIGSLGAAILSVIWPTLIEQYGVAELGQQATIKTLFSTFSSMVYGGMWNLLNCFLGGLWWLGAGFVLKRIWPRCGWLGIFVGLISIIDGMANMLQIHWLAELALNIFLVLAPIWALVFGITLIKRPLQ